MYINNVKVNAVNYSSFLGVILDSDMSWFHHIQYINNKIPKVLGIMSKARKVFKETTLQTLYNSLIYPYLSYCVEVWGTADETKISSLVKVQKKALRMIVSAPYKAPSKPIFDKLNILDMNSIYFYSTALFMFKYEHSILPEVFNIFFRRNYDVHKYSTRYNKHLIVLQMKSALYKKKSDIWVLKSGTSQWNLCNFSVIYSHLNKGLKDFY